MTHARNARRKARRQNPVRYAEAAALVRCRKPIAVFGLDDPRVKKLLKVTFERVLARMPLPKRGGAR